MFVTLIAFDKFKFHDLGTTVTEITDVFEAMGKALREKSDRAAYPRSRKGANRLQNPTVPHGTAERRKAEPFH